MQRKLDERGYMAILCLHMAIPKIKGTYSLDVETIQALERIASRWGVSKSEALRRAIQAAAAQAGEGTGGILEALGQLQDSVALSKSRARDWARSARAERRAGSVRQEPADR